MRRVSVAMIALAFCVAGRAAHAKDPLNSAESSERYDDDAGKHPEAHDDFNIVPVVGGSTDIGVGVGHFMGLARKAPGAEPYAWNLESASP